jgi:hypothetical protein
VVKDLTEKNAIDDDLKSRIIKALEDFKSQFSA